MGTFHKVSRKYLPLYVAEFQSRYFRDGDKRMLIIAKKWKWLALAALAMFVLWLLYVLLGATSFQACIVEKDNKQTEQTAKENSPEVMHSLIVSLRIRTDCAARFLYDSRDFITAIATLFIAFFTLTLWRSTNNLWKETVASSAIARKSADAAIKTADAAKESADALVASERAYVFVEILLEENIKSSPSGFPNLINVKIWNYGNTPAEIVKIRAYFVIESHVPLELIEFEGSDRELPPGLGIGKDCSYDIQVRRLVTDPELGQIERWEKKLYCVGLIVYKDIFGKRRETGFCWHILYRMSEAKFTLTHDSPLNKRT